MLKHTPGPWTTDWGFILAQRADGRDNYIAETVKSDEEALYIEDIEEREANSHMLAAAPEMFEALDGLVDALYRIGFEDDANGCDVIDILNDWLPEIKSAICKAMGANP